MVTLPAATVPKNALSLGAGYLYYSGVGLAFPANTVAASGSVSVFTDAWPGNWFLLGITKNGSELNYAPAVSEIMAEEYLDPVAYTTTGRSSGMKFELMQIHATNIYRALNGGTLTTSGAGGTLLSTYKPPAAGAEIRCMLGWESQDNSERVVAEQALQTGELAINRRKGADNATLPLEWKFEIPASGTPYFHYFAGTIRG